MNYQIRMVDALPVSTQKINLESRRYIGNKNKLFRGASNILSNDS